MNPKNLDKWKYSLYTIFTVIVIDMLSLEYKYKIVLLLLVLRALMELDI